MRGDRTWSSELVARLAIVQAAFDSICGLENPSLKTWDNPDPIEESSQTILKEIFDQKREKTSIVSKQVEISQAWRSLQNTGRKSSN